MSYIKKGIDRYQNKKGIDRYQNKKVSIDTKIKRYR
jgi:hypothetical protein